MNKNIIIGVIIVLILIIGLGIYWQRSENKTAGQLDQFALCLAEKGAKFYGAFWCPHCQNQKKMFGSSAKFLPYVECSTSDGGGQLAVCTEAKVIKYPTWIFADGSLEIGELTVDRLAEKTGCVLPVK